MAKYVPPKGTIARVIPVRSSVDPKKWALYNTSLGTRYGLARSYEETKKAADKENIRHATYTKAMGIK